MYPITTFTGSLFGLFYIFLSIQVISLRRKEKISLGAQENKKLKLSIRAHANFSEYVPLALLLFLCAEANNANFFALALAALIFITGRTAHAVAFLYNIHHIQLRTLGMLCTFITLGYLAIQNLILLLL